MVRIQNECKSISFDGIIIFTINAIFFWLRNILFMFAITFLPVQWLFSVAKLSYIVEWTLFAGEKGKVKVVKI
jgi:hypothetical protein